MENAKIEEVGSLDNVQSELKEVGDYLLQSRERQRKLRLWGHGVTLAIVIVFAIYIIAMYSMLSNNLSGEKFNKSLQTRVAQIAPIVTNSSVEVITQVSPVYMDLARKKLNKMMPELTKSLGKHADRFVAYTLNVASEEFDTLMENIISQQSEEFRKAYPDLTDEQIGNFITETQEDLQTVFIQLSKYIANHPIPDTLERELVHETLLIEQKHHRNIELYNLFLQKLLPLLSNLDD